MHDLIAMQLEIALMGLHVYITKNALGTFLLCPYLIQEAGHEQSAAQVGDFGHCMACGAQVVREGTGGIG